MEQDRSHLVAEIELKGVRLFWGGDEEFIYIHRRYNYHYISQNPINMCKFTFFLEHLLHILTR